MRSGIGGADIAAYALNTGPAGAESMSEGINTNSSRGAQPPSYPWPGPGKDAPAVTWAEFLRLAAEDCEHRFPGSPGRFIGAYLHALSAQSITLEADGPESHESKAEQVRLQEAAYIQALEDRSDYWSITEPDPCDDVTGSLDGHMDQDGPSQVWLGDPSCDDTYMN
jgi:hypothetical protein